MATIAMAGFLIEAGDGWGWRLADKGARATKLDSVALIQQWQTDIRGGICYLQYPQVTQHAPQCIEQKRPMIFLWGDSHAASLYPGLARLQQTHNFGITQLTQSDCPPLLGIKDPADRPHCGQINQAVLQQAAQVQPELIMLAAAWARADYRLNPQETIDNLLATIAAIRQAAPHAHIIVMGQAPRWLSPLPAIYRRSLTFGDQVPPVYSSAHLDPAVTALDLTLSARLAAAGIDFISLQKYLCNDQGCLTRTGEDISGIAFVDNEHMAAETSRRVAAGFAPHLLEDLGKRK
jgi:hypothetical protein